MLCDSVLNLSIVLGVLILAAQEPKKVRLPSAEEIGKMEAAMPPAHPVAKPFRLLVMGSDPWHDPVPYCSKALEIMGRKTGFFAPAITDDGSHFEPERLKEFDVVVVNSWHGFDPFLGATRKEFEALPAERKGALKEQEARRRKALLDFVAGGKGLVGIHAATVGLADWKEYHEMIGGRYVALPYLEAAVKVDDPGHPVNAAFGGKGFRLADEFYELQAPYSRETLRVLLSVDTEAMKGVEKVTKYGKPVRTDGDYGLSWVKAHGKGRVFYSALGHFSETYWNPAMLRHFFDGIRFAAGELAADTTPSARVKK